MMRPADTGECQLERMVCLRPASEFGRYGVGVELEEAWSGRVGWNGPNVRAREAMRQA